jgi:hypothetical protein
MRLMELQVMSLVGLFQTMTIINATTVVLSMFFQYSVVGTVAKLTASDGADNDYFGYSVSVLGNTAVIGNQDDDMGDSSGSAYVLMVGKSPD